MDDAALFTARFADGAIGSFEATRFALGRKNALRIEVNGTTGSVAFDFEDNNVLQFFDGPEPAREQGFRRIVATEADHPYVGAWWPPGHGLGYEHGFTHQVVDLVKAIADRRATHPVLRRRSAGPAGARRRRGERPNSNPSGPPFTD